MPSRHAIACNDPREAAEALAREVESGDIILLKAAEQVSVEQLIPRLRPAKLHRAA